jgi:hypothetical protein
MRLDSLRHVCSVENTETDTQASIFADLSAKVLVASFRGTEQIKIQDILTDINLKQAPFFPTSTSTSTSASSKMAPLTDALVHSGFLAAFRSVQPAVLQILNSTLCMTEAGAEAGAEEKEWEIYVTGHSLGGALATLFSLDLGRIKAGLVDNAPLSSDPAKPYAYAPDGLFARTLQRAQVTVYTYGAPRVGCPKFVRLYDSLCGTTFRIVNSYDIVARMPRSSQVSRLMEYEHVGRTVLVGMGGDGECEGSPLLAQPGCLAPSGVWVEGESEGACPLADLSPFSSASASASASASSSSSSQPLLTGPSFIASTVASVGDAVDKAVAFVANSAGLGAQGAEQIQFLASALSDAAGGVSERFVAKEMAFLNSILDGSGLAQHLEPSYFAALESASSASSAASSSSSSASSSASASGRG